MGELERFWTTFQDTTLPAQVRGNLVPDAQFATLVGQHRVGTVWSHHRDRRFNGIRVRDLFAPRPADRAQRPSVGRLPA